MKQQPVKIVIDGKLSDSLFGKDVVEARPGSRLWLGINMQPMIAELVPARLYNALAAVAGGAPDTAPDGFLATSTPTHGLVLVTPDGVAHRRGRFSDDPPACWPPAATGTTTPARGADHAGPWCGKCFGGGQR